ncbi:hypothetical protein AM571_PC01844 (plasmid) [Rhizobium etli 8C-3]|uniref:Uncharacterized protein n=1 Tax=Rhizobium etli 8C-3 TaxID=538025 RepID=A0A1L5PHB2_RHIET|nr:hypothetical protein AM571_PC01844 [Rhizobium etli 8C-3]
MTTDVLALELKRCEEGRVCPAFFVPAEQAQHRFIDQAAVLCVRPLSSDVPIQIVLPSL